MHHSDSQNKESFCFVKNISVISLIGLNSFNVLIKIVSSELIFLASKILLIPS